MNQNCKRDEIGLYAICCRALWEDRNKFLYSLPVPSIEVKSRWIVTYFTIFRAALNLKELRLPMLQVNTK